MQESFSNGRWALRHSAAELDVFGMSQATLELITELINQMTLVNIKSVYHTHGDCGIRMHCQAMVFLSSTVGRYQLRILSL